ncbi:MAG: sensor histidine kinase [Gemmatimonadota bacterium]
MRPYWACQVAGWSLYALIGGGVPTLYGGLRWPVVARALVGATLGLGLTHYLRRHIQRNGWLRLSLRRLIPRILAASVVIAVVMVTAVMPFLFLFIPSNRAGAISAILLGHGAIVFVWCVIYFAVHYLRGLRAEEAEKWRLELAVRDTELRALRGQLNPHFLFNSLNSLRGLILESPQRAQEAVTRLASLLRFALLSSRSRTISLDQELEATRHYLDLESLRFEARLRYRFDVDTEALEQAVPPLLVQTLVENAIKHGIANLPQGGSVRIEARKRAKDLCIRVTNTGSLQDRRDGDGIGLANSLDRLRLTFGEAAEITLAASGTGEVICEVVIPTPVP